MDLLMYPKYQTKGALIPENTSKFLPSKVISSGTILYVNSQYKTSSTGMRTTCKIVNPFSFIPSMNRLPDVVANRKAMAIKGGKTSNTNLGGNDFVSA